MAGRGAKEQAMRPLALWLVGRGVTADMVTGAGVAATALAQRIRLSQLNKVDTSIDESGENESLVQQWLRVLADWAPTALMVLALSADALDGEVAREQVRQNGPQESVINGQLVDGLADRLTISIMAFGLFWEYAQAGKNAAAVIAALDAFLVTLPSLLRALVEKRGGKTIEQSFNPIKFGGTHAGRWLMLIFLSLKYDQVLPVIKPFLGTRAFEREQWETVRIGLLSYLTVSTSVVIIERARDLAQTFKPDFVSASTDSSGFNEKTAHDHEQRANWYGVVAGLLGLASGVAISSLRKHDQ